MARRNDHRPPAAIEPGIVGAAREGCPEARLLMSRRAMLGVTAALFSSAFLPNYASADTDPEARFLVVVLRGGMDGIGMTIPKLDPHYESVRRELAVPFEDTLSLGTDFALHPGLANVHAMYLAGQAAVVPAAGIPLRIRSHFECQDNLENGLAVNRPDATGWLNRLLGALPAGDPIRVRQGLEIGEAPLILRGPEPVLGWSPTWFEKSKPENLARLEAVYTALDPALWDSLHRGIIADEMALENDAGDSDVSPLRRGFIGAARLMRVAEGPRISVLSVGGWDTHTDQGAATGQFNDRLLELDEALEDLRVELGDAWAKTVAICVTEFGRTVRTNGDSGTDHGVGTTALMVGGGVAGGIVGDWPGIGPDELYEGSDLTPTVDLRSVFKGILTDHIGVPPEILDSIVFPESGDVHAAPRLIASPKRLLTPVAKFKRPPTPQEVSPIAIYRSRYGLGPGA